MHLFQITGAPHHTADNMCQCYIMNRFGWGLWIACASNNRAHISEQTIYEDFTPQKGKKSGIWNYFHFKVNRSGTREKGHVYCKICDCALSYNPCTTNMWKHVNRKHWKVVHVSIEIYWSVLDLFSKRNFKDKILSRWNSIYLIKIIAGQLENTGPSHDKSMVIHC